MNYKKYFRKTSLKQKGIGKSFLNEIEKKKPKTFLEVGVFHGVTARNVCELLYKIHKNDFKYIKKIDPYSIEAVNDLLKKFKDNVHLIKGNSNELLKKIDVSKVDYVFLDGGHHYNTVKNDLNNCIEVIENKGTVLCDDYNLTYAPGVKKAIDEFIDEHKFQSEILFDRFVKIEKKINI